MFQPNLYSTNLVKSSMFYPCCAIHNPLQSFTFAPHSFAICLSDRQCLYPCPYVSFFRLFSFHSACNWANPTFGKLFFFHIFCAIESKTSDTIMCSFVFFARLFIALRHEENLHFMENLNGIFK